MSTREVVLVDAGGTNIGSLRYAFERLGIGVELSADAARIRAASHVILPGVGAAAPGMARLREAGLVEVLRGLTQPVLGVCLGMQLLFEHSEEGDTPCLGIIPGRVRRIVGDEHRRVPHMGWNRLAIERCDALLAGIDAHAWAYFVHGYAAAVDTHTLARVDHGESFAAIVRVRNFTGMQFHPARSSALGARLLANFIAT